MTSLLRYLQEANTHTVVSRHGQTEQYIFNRNRAQHGMMKDSGEGIMRIYQMPLNCYSNHG